MPDPGSGHNRQVLQFFQRVGAAEMNPTALSPARMSN